jgi:ABC-2 type transport system permease protein
VPPSGEEVARSLVFLVFALAYAGVWLALAMLYSILFRSPATAALSALGTWLLLAVLWPMLAPAFAEAIAPPDPRFELLGLPTLGTLEWTQALLRISPNHLFGEVVLALLSPSTRSLGPVFLDQLQGAINGAPLTFADSLAVAWPQAVALVAGMIVLFAAGYVAFQRQEVRA